MELDPHELNPMWAPRTALAASPHAAHRGDAPREGAESCRVAIASSEVRALLDAQRGAACITQVITWDAPLMLLADDAPLTVQIRAAGVTIIERGGTYAERQWDAREALEEAAHRFYDHQETWGVRGMTTRQPRTTVAIVEGALQVHALLSALVQFGAPPEGAGDERGAGLVLDGRDPLDLRIFVVDSIGADRALVVHPAGIEEYRRAEVLERVLGERPHR